MIDPLGGTVHAGSPFEVYLYQHRGLVLSEFGRVFSHAEKDPDLGRYLHVPDRDFTRRGGKMVRPVLCLLGAEAVGGDRRLAMSSAIAVERFQTAALIHDDIADEGQVRRGRPCMHLTEGVGVAINVGDGALVEVVGGVLDDACLDDATKLRLVRELVQMERRTVEGQALDLGWTRDGRWDVTVDDYLRMATLKTAHYSCATPLVLGAICGGGTDEQAEALRAFGLDAGLAFQLQDDLLNLVGSEDEQGKDLRSDITEGKRTLAAVWTLSHAEDGDRDELAGLLGSHTDDPDKLARAVDIMQGCGAIDHVREEALRLSESAKDRLANVTLADEAREVLESMADFFVERLR